MVRELMNPCGIVANDDTPLAPRSIPEGKVVIGLFSNQKANADLFLDNIQELLGERFAERYGDVEFLRGYKAASVPAEFSDEFLNRCHMVAAAFGD
jgi:hypothetical protein